jgi:alkylation response protein AidB-like acyl-CoA dehydrogenase
MASYLELNKEITPEESSIKEQIHRFGLEVLRPVASDLDKMSPEDVIADSSPLWDVFKQAYSLGYPKRGLPEALGGVHMSPLASHVYAEEMGWASSDFAIGLGVASFPFNMAAMSGNPDLIENIVKPFAEDTEARYIGCWAITEPQHGSDTLHVGQEAFKKPETAFELQATLDGDEWVISVGVGRYHRDARAGIPGRRQVPRRLGWRCGDHPPGQARCDKGQAAGQARAACPEPG